MAFYDIYDSLCKQRGITPTQAARDNGIAQGVVSMWKKRGSTPKGETLQKLAEYFGVTVDYLLGFTLQAQIDETQHKIAQLKQELEHATAEEKDEILASLEVLEESYSDLYFARELAQETEKAPTPEGERKITMDDFSVCLFNATADLSEADRRLLLDMARRLRDTGGGTAAVRTSDGPYYLYGYPDSAEAPSVDPESTPAPQETTDTTPPQNPPETP